MKAASLDSRAFCFMRPCSANTGMAGLFPDCMASRAAAMKSTQAHVSAYTITFSAWCSCTTRAVRHRLMACNNKSQEHQQQAQGG